MQVDGDRVKVEITKGYPRWFLDSVEVTLADRALRTAPGVGNTKMVDFRS